MPDLVISDVTMPELEGYGVLQQLRSNPETATIPLIFLTAWNDRENLRRGMELGADDYLTKPFVVSDLLPTVRTQIEKRHKLIARREERLEHLRGNIALAEHIHSGAIRLNGSFRTIYPMRRLEFSGWMNHVLRHCVLAKPIPPK